ncbi:single-stranded DNA-binding protein [Methylovirgula sp. HY1]|uniref:single-stranded DNA-binding protein n=1 Tax=Methylovirgula sp. HY1 TaxID=2822761 RepID=UPI001C5ACDC8|nr:single-stranded DNA-binding protein [Methylovirgula sp. HY1]QXX74268.1 Single-stranded DNA-binding protein [Methylovirgula sp. HY1]
MAGSLNKVILIGHLGRDPDVRRMQSGDAVVSFSMATSETWRDKATGERKERAEWHNVVIFNEHLAKIAEQYLKKGALVLVEGKMRTREYTDRDGANRRTTEVVLDRFGGELVLLDRVERAAPDPDSYGTTRTRSASSSEATGEKPGTTSEMIGDEIPF